MFLVFYVVFKHTGRAASAVTAAKVVIFRLSQGIMHSFCLARRPSVARRCPPASVATSRRVRHDSALVGGQFLFADVEYMFNVGKYMFNVGKYIFNVVK